MLVRRRLAPLNVRIGKHKAHSIRRNSSPRRISTSERHKSLSDYGTLKERLIARLGDYAAIDAVAGHEHAMVARLQSDLAPHVDDMRIDPFGNVIATRRGAQEAP